MNLLFRRLYCPGTDAAVAADAATKGATDAAVAGGAADVGAGVAGAGIADAALAGGADAALAGGGSALAGAGAADAAGAGLGAAGASDAAIAGMLPEVTVSASALPGEGLGAAGWGAGAAGAAGAAGLAGGGGGPAMKSSFLPATSDASVQPLSADIASNFGVDPSAPGMQPLTSSQLTDPGMAGVSDMAAPSVDITGTDTGGFDPLSWLKNPRNLATAGMLGISGLNALKTPKLPGATQTALNAAGPAVGEATNIIKSGGTNTPLWQTQKSSIDASINQQIQQQTEALLQTAANQGMGNQNSPVVQQMLAQMKNNLEAQRQSLYLQAQQQNVGNAIAELTGSNQVLQSVGEIQLAQDQEARAAAGQTAELALLLQSLG